MSNRRVLSSNDISRIRHRLSVIRPEIRDSIFPIDVLKEIPILNTASYNIEAFTVFGLASMEENAPEMYEDVRDDLVMVLRSPDSIIFKMDKFSYIVIYGVDSEYEPDVNWSFTIGQKIFKTENNTLDEVCESLKRQLYRKEFDFYE